MKQCLQSSFCLVLLLFLISFPVKAVEDQTGTYHDFTSLTKALNKLNTLNPKLSKLTSIGKSAQGRDLWMLQLSGPNGPSPEEKQALLICANAEGDHLIGSEIALGIAEYLIKNYNTDEKVTKVLNKRTFYIIPRLNPDGAELFFATPQREYSGNLKPRDDDYDWLLDEDGPEDLNGDGKITMMRVKDKEGEWIIDKKDARLMKKKAANSALDSLYKLYPEGIDNDGDELYNEDGPGGFNINRNFPHNYGYKPKGVGVYPASENETQALIDFLSRYVPELKNQPRRNICGVLLFSKYDNLAAGTGIEGGTPTYPEPPRTGQAQSGRTGMMFMMGRRGAPAAPTARPTDPQPKKTNAADTALFKSVSEKYKDITGIKSAHSDKPFGSLLEYAYFQFGVPAFSANLWSLRQESGAGPQTKAPTKKAASGAAAAAGQSDRRAMMQRMMTSSGARGSAAAGSTNNDSKWLQWIDKKNQGKGFVPWTKFTHKQLGEVEIGGFEPYLRVNPPAEQIPELAKSHGQFALFLAAQFAEISMEEPQVTKLSSNVYELKIKVHNLGKFPYVTGMGQRSRNISPIMLRIKFEDDKNMKMFGGNKRVDIPNLAASEEKEIKWVIISPTGKKLKVTLWARNGGGTTEKQIVLK